MFESQHFVDSQDNGGGFVDSRSWISGEPRSSPVLSRTDPSSSPSNAAGNVDPVLYNDLVELIPLVQSLMNKSSSFTRHGSMTYTKTPSRKSHSKKKGKNAAQSISTKKGKDYGGKYQRKDGSSDKEYEDSLFSSKALTSDKDKEELISLREQLEDLKKKLAEKDELLKSTENQVTSVQLNLEKLKHQVAEKDSVIESAQLQLSDSKIKLADKQAALEKLLWELQTSNRKVDNLQKELVSVQGEMSSLLMLFESLSNSGPSMSSEDLDGMLYQADYLPEIDDLDEMEMQKMEEARVAYIAAVAATKERQDEGSMAIAANARSHLQSFVIRTESERSKALAH